MEVIILGAVVFGLAYAFTHRGGTRTGTDDWQPGRTAATTGQRHLDIGSQRSAGLQLARVEGRQLLRNEVFIVGIAMSIAILVIFGVIWASDNLGAQNSWRYWLALLPVFTLPFAGLTMVAANLAALRSRRDGTEELFSSLPATDATRVVGHLGSVWMAFVIQAIFVIGNFLNGWFITDHFGAVDMASIGDIAVSFMLVASAVALAVALARWLPHPLVALAALVALGIGGSAIGGIGGHHWSLTRQLSIWPRYPDHDWAFAVRPNWWHAAYLLALATVVAVVAVARQRRDRPIAILAAVTVTLAAVTGFLQTRPMSDRDADRIASMIANPVTYSTCHTTDGLTLCAYQDYADITSVWANELSAPFAAVPPARQADGFTVVWREPRLDRLDPAVQQRIDADALNARWDRDPATWNGVAIVGTDSAPVNRLALGLWSVGLPLVAAEDTPCSVSGQARGVVALWIAAQGKSADAATSFVSGSWSGINNSDTTFAIPSEWIDGYVWNGDEIPPVLWSKNDIAAAQALVGIDVATVRDAIWADWAQWTDPTTSTDQLLATFGLEPVGPSTSLPAGIVACR